MDASNWQALGSAALEGLGLFLRPDTLAWLGVLALFGAGAAPFTHRLLHRTRVLWLLGAAAFGWAAFGWAVWLAGHDAFGWRLDAVGGRPGFGRLVRFVFGNGLGALPFTRFWLRAALGVFLAAGAWGWMRWGGAMRARLRRERGAVLVGLAPFFVLFAFGAVLRMHAPGIVDQEKYMDFAFLNACRWTPTLPPPDPWLYEGSINYYYGGYLLNALPAKLTGGIEPGVAYNFGAATALAMTGLLAWALAYELTRRKRWALVGLAAVALMGNQALAVRHLEVRRGEAEAFSYDWFQVSRVIHDQLPDKDVRNATINEFPFFAFYHADLHPHMTAFPWTLLFLGFVFNLFGRGRPFGEGRWRIARFLATAGMLGMLGFLNGFDLATYGFVFVLAVGLRQWLAARGWRRALAGNALVSGGLLLLAAGGALWIVREWAQASKYYPQGFLLPALVAFGTGGVLICHARRSLPPKRFHALWSVRTTKLALLAPLTAALCVAPFLVNFDAPVHSTPFPSSAKEGIFPALLLEHLRNGLAFGLTRFRSRPGEFLTVWATHLAALALFAALALAQAPRLGAGRLRTLPAVLAAAFALGWVLFGGVVAAGLFALLAAGALAFAARPKRPETAFVFALTASALVVLIGCEVVHLRDVYGEGLQRMNTIFKFHFACWALLGVCLPWFIQSLFRATGARRLPGRLAGLLALAILAAATEYPARATMERLRNRFGAPDLTGTEYLAESRPGDMAAIRWLRANAEPNAVALEAVGGSYTRAARIATHTPVRAVLGWPGHESIWRGASFAAVEAETKTIYRTPSIESARALLQKYGVRYVVVGSFERSDYPAAGLEKFEALCGPPVFEDAAAGARVYRFEAEKGG